MIQPASRPMPLRLLPRPRVRLLSLLLVLTLLVPLAGCARPTPGPSGGKTPTPAEDPAVAPEIRILADEPFETPPGDWSHLTDRNNLELVPMEPGTPLYPAPRGQQVLGVTSGRMELFRDLGPMEPDTVYTLTLSVASASPTNLGSLSVSLLDPATGKAHALGFSAQGASFKVDAVVWNRVTLVVDTSALSETERSGHLAFEIRGSLVYVDDLLVTARRRRAMTFHVSASEGSGDGTGSLANPFDSFRILNGTRLLPGDRVLVRRGDTFRERVYLTGKGEPERPIRIEPYGEGAMPLITLGENRRTDVALTYENASHVRIAGLHMENAKIGLYLRYYKDYGNRDVVVEDCLFRKMDDLYCAPQEYQNELGFSSGIWLSGFNPGGASDVLDGLVLRSNRFEYCTSGFNTNWFYFDPVGHPKDILRNVLVEGGHALASSVAGSLLIQWTDGVVIRHFRQFGRNPLAETEWFLWGSTGLMIGSSQNILVENSEFADVDRFADNKALMQELADNPERMRELAGSLPLYFGLHQAFSGDASGVDIDGNNENVTFRNNVVHDNDGMGLQLLTTLGANRNVVIEGCTFYNNGTNVKNKWEVRSFEWNGSEWVIEYDTSRYLFGGDAWEVKLDTAASGRLADVRLYRADESFGWVSRSGIQFSRSGIGELWYRDVRDLPSEFRPDRSGTVLSDAETDPVAGTGVVEIGPLFLNGFQQPILELDLSVSAGERARVYYITDLDRDYSPDRWFDVPLQGEAAGRVDTLADGFKGVLVGLRIRPSDEAGAEYTLRSVRFAEKPDPSATPGVSGTPATTTPSADGGSGARVPLGTTLLLLGLALAAGLLLALGLRRVSRGGRRPGAPTDPPSGAPG